MVAAVAGFAGYHFSRARSSPPQIEVAAQKLMRASYADLNGRYRNLSPSPGKVLVVNFWATWCTPCREEIPELSKIHKRYASKGVEVTGIAFDNTSKVLDYAAKMNMDYSLLIGTVETLAISKDLGNPAGVLPFTVVLDRTGTVTYTHVGALTAAILEAVLLPIL
ncbi:MAG: TlpA family protein disulfide reductase [Burkholderiales bacterium]|nr:TlpA family protein disulfide reductase [Burkholderiales bacterium]